MGNNYANLCSYMKIGRTRISHFEKLVMLYNVMSRICAQFPKHGDIYSSSKKGDSNFRVRTVAMSSM